MPYFRRRKRLRAEIQPDEIFIDAANPAALDIERFEGRMERPLGSRSFWFVLAVPALSLLVFIGQAINLQLLQGTAYAKQAAENKLSQEVIFADRGIIADRAGRELASNRRADITDDFAARVYASTTGIAHVLGYTKAPAKDASGVYFRNSYEGIDGAEQIFNQKLSGRNGLRLSETDARGKVVSESTQRVPVPGEKVTLSIDAEVTEALYRAIEARAKNSGFRGGAGVIMDIHTGELLALTSYPEYSPSVLLGGNKDALAALLGDTRQPFLDRAVSGLYAPGSIVKPMVALAALTEGVIDEHTQILSTGQISIPNPYDPSKPTIFRDWRAHGFTDMREAIAVSSDVYFYAVGGGYKNQIGLGIQRLDTYLRMFGFGSPTGLEGVEEPAGTIPTPAWKEKNFPGDPWRIGNTYHTAIGQYGVQVTPLQAARATAALANGGLLLTPSLVASSSPKVADTLNFSEQDLRVVREGMRMSVTQGIAAAVNLPYVEVAAKTGTAQLGANNEYINSWVIGFFPYKNPKYAFAVVLEKAPASTNVGAVVAMHAFFQWMQANAPQYLK